MFTHLPVEIRLLIWETLLYQPRIVYINMRYMVDDIPAFCGTDKEDGSTFECLSSTPIPVLLHLCSETRVLALAYYELTFGRANDPVLRPRMILKHGFSIKGKEYETVIESNEAEVAKYAPRIYFNFEHDTVVFGRTLLQRGQEPRHGEYLTCFPFNKHFEPEQLERIKNLALRIDTPLHLPFPYTMFDYLDHHIGVGSFRRLQKLYLCLETDGVDPSRGVKLVDLREKVKEDGGDQGMAQKFVDIWKSKFNGEGVGADGMDIEGVRIICKDGLRRRNQMRELLLKNGASPDEVLK